MIVTMSEGDFTGGQLKVCSCVVVARLYSIYHKFTNQFIDAIVIGLRSDGVRVEVEDVEARTLSCKSDVKPRAEEHIRIRDHRPSDLQSRCVMRDVYRLRYSSSTITTRRAWKC